MRVSVKLNRSEMILSHMKALERAASNSGQIDRSRQKLSWHDCVSRDAEACGAEIAFAGWLGLQDFVPTVDTFKNGADVGSRYEVKWSHWEDGSLILTERDRESDIAVLVTGVAPNLFLCGWIPIAVARRPRQQRSDGSWWIGQKDLHPMENLRRSIHGENTSL